MRADGPAKPKLSRDALNRLAQAAEDITVVKRETLGSLARECLREEGVQTTLVNSYGRPWTADGFGGSFNRIRDATNIDHVDEETGIRKKKHLHDVRGTFATRRIAQPAGLSDQEVADMMAWSPQQVADIRRVYVDQARVVVAIGERIRMAL